VSYYLEPFNKVGYAVRDLFNTLQSSYFIFLVLNIEF